MKESLSGHSLKQLYFSFSFGTKTPTDIANKSFSLVEIQEKAKNFLTASANSSAVDNAVLLYNMIEDFCRETDRYVETEKKNHDDLNLQVSVFSVSFAGAVWVSSFYFLLVSSSDFSNLQIEAADKQLKATRQFLEDQAAEREQERDEFSKEIEKLRLIVKEKDKEKTAQDSLTKEVRIFNILSLLHTFLFSRRNYLISVF